MRARTVMPLALVCVALAGGCGGGKAEPELEAGVLQIGAVPGPTRADSEVVNGVRAAVRELNRGGGIDEKVRLSLLLGRARRLGAAGVGVVVLPCDARLQAASAAIARRHALVLAPCNTQLWRRYSSVWPISVSPSDEAGVLAGYARDQGYRRVAVVGDGKIALAVRAAARKDGLALVPPGRADAVVVALAAPFAQAAAVRLRAAGIEAPLLGTHGFDDRAGIARHRRALEGVVFTTFGYPDPGSELDELYERYRAVTGHRPDGSVAGLGYDAVRVLASAVHEAASTKRSALAASMPGLDTAGATGSIEYPLRGGRDPRATLALVRVERGRLALVDRVGV
jgi:ABC-type branched-subunit amino acid transport system substrate-binding protein